jgi:Uma2 family endonuclease
MALGSGVRFLADDIWDTPEDGNRYEVIDGELYVTPPPIEPHQRTIHVLDVLLGVHILAHDLGRLYPAPIGVVLPGSATGVQPDLVYVAREHTGIIVERGIEGSPDHVIEILSPSTQARDRGVKMRAYAAAGIPHYWIVDGRARRLEAYRLGEDGYGDPQTYGLGTIFRPELFPGLEIPIDRLWS